MITASFIGKATGLICILGLIRKLICSAEAMTSGLGYAIRITKSDENVRCHSREFVETLYVREPVDYCDLPPGELTDINVHGDPARRIQCTTSSDASAKYGMISEAIANAVRSDACSGRVPKAIWHRR
jgi:hypothetical protein